MRTVSAKMDTPVTRTRKFLCSKSGRDLLLCSALVLFLLIGALVMW